MRSIPLRERLAGLKHPHQAARGIVRFGREHRRLLRMTPRMNQERAPHR